ncbi:MAG: aminodeoxychorismate/anthranilate synthase component II [Trueperaceae bacterium]
MEGTAADAVASAPRLLVIDNYDSFTYNLVQYLAELGAEVTVWRNDAFELSDVAELDPDGIVVSPGPCTPAQAGNSVAVIREYSQSVPLLGVCLGHQAIGEAFGASVVRAARLVHGKTSAVQHDGSGPFAGLPNPLTATRYHSLVVEDLPAELEPIGWTTDVLPDGSEVRVLMGLKHVNRPVWGVQFHPESVLTEAGHELLSNFMKVAVDWRAGRDATPRT